MICTLPPSCTVSSKSEPLAVVHNHTGAGSTRTAGFRRCGRSEARATGTAEVPQEEKRTLFFNEEEFLPLPKAPGRVVKRNRGRT